MVVKMCSMKTLSCVLLIFVASVQAGVATPFRRTIQALTTELVVRQTYMHSSNRVVEVTAQDYPLVYEIISRLATKAAINRPLMFVITRRNKELSPQMNAFAVGGKYMSAIFVGQRLVEELTAQELEGILAHEIAHIQLGHVEFLFLSSLFLKKTAVAELSQLLESEADAQSVNLTGHKGICGGLQKLSDFLRKYKPFSAWYDDFWFNRLSFMHPRMADRIEVINRRVVRQQVA